jgi:hypothetical protein
LFSPNSIFLLGVQNLHGQAGTDGMNKICSRFTTIHPEISKRQVELKINELAVKAGRFACKD